MENPKTKQRWINRPFVKGLLGGIVTMAACSLSTPFFERFEPSLTNPYTGSFFGDTIIHLGVPLGILLAVGWLANKTLGNFGFVGFKISEEFQAKGCLGYVAGGLIYFIAAVIALILIQILTRAL